MQNLLTIQMSILHKYILGGNSIALQAMQQCKAGRQAEGLCISSAALAQQTLTCCCDIAVTVHSSAVPACKMYMITEVTTSSAGQNYKQTLRNEHISALFSS